jgi:hypothetical protein
MFTVSGFAKKFSLDPSCVFFDDSDASDIKVNDSTIEITSSMLLKASVYCEVNSECEESDKKISCNLLISPQ